MEARDTVFRLPRWMKVPMPKGENYSKVRNLMQEHQLNTICTSGNCPNKGECWNAGTIKMIKLRNPETTLEVLIPDFNGVEEHVQIVIDAGPEVISHNVETVERLTPRIRSNSYYHTSLKVIRQVAGSGIVPKSGIMLGLGEREEEVLQTMRDLKDAGCRVITIGQYLQPDSSLAKVEEYVRPEVFEHYRIEGLKMGFSFVESHPLVRSSYHAEKHVTG